jgi:hypothetical protein
MASMQSQLDPVSRVVVGGVDTHKDLHVDPQAQGRSGRVVVALMWRLGLQRIIDDILVVRVYGWRSGRAWREKRNRTRLGLLTALFQNAKMARESDYSPLP